MTFLTLCAFEMCAPVSATLAAHDSAVWACNPAVSTGVDADSLKLDADSRKLVASHLKCWCVQILGMLRGLRCPGSAFQLDADGHGYTVQQGVHVGHLSPSCLRKLLQRFAEAGNMALMCALCCADASFRLLKLCDAGADVVAQGFFISSGLVRDSMSQQDFRAYTFQQLCSVVQLRLCCALGQRLACLSTTSMLPRPWVWQASVSQ